MQPAPLIRTAHSGDIPAIAAIYGHYVVASTATFEIHPPGPAEMCRRYNEIVQRGLPYMVAECDGKAVGYAYAALYRSREAYRFTVEDSVYVHPDYVGRGIGTALMGPLIERCRRRGSRQMIAIVGDSANTGSIRMHERLGFRSVGTLEGVGFKFGRWLDTVILQRKLD